MLMIFRATLREYTNLVNELSRDPDVNKEMIEGHFEVNSKDSTLFHMVAEIGNDHLSEQLICASKSSPEYIVNCRCMHFLPGDSELGIEKQEIYQTPISIAIGKKNIGILKAIHKLNESLHTLTSLNLSNVCIASVPEEILIFSSLKELDLSYNILVELPLNNNIIKKIKIEDLNLSHNNFESVSDKLFDLLMLKSLNISSNALAEIPTNWWRASKLQELDVSNNKITIIGMEPIYDVDCKLLQQSDAITSVSLHTPAVSHVTSRLRQRISLQDVNVDSDGTSDESLLTVLRLNNNLLESFPRGLACLAPNLESLHLERNKINDLCSIRELPCRLQNLDISHNIIDSSNLSIFHVADTPLYCFRVSNQSYSSCSHMDHDNLYNLAHLNCNHNKITEISLFTKTQNMFFPNLISLDISHNELTNLPTKLDQFTRLRYLYISNNQDVEHIPRDIGYIGHLIEFEYNNISDPLIETLNNTPHISDKLTYLRSIQQRYSLAISILLVIITTYIATCQKIVVLYF